MAVLDRLAPYSLNHIDLGLNRLLLEIYADQPTVRAKVYQQIDHLLDIRTVIQARG